MKALPSPARRPEAGSFRALVLAAILTLPLASCDILFSGMFPPDIAQVTARVDLSAEITGEDASSFTLSVVKTAGAEYVLLFSIQWFDPAATHLFVLSPTLQVLNRYTMDYLTGTVAPAGSPFKGSTAVSLLPGNTAIIGNLTAVPGATGLDITGKLPGGVELSENAILDTPTGNIWTHFKVDGTTGNLTWDIYTPSGAPSTPSMGSHPIGRPVSECRVLAAPADITRTTVLVEFGDWTDSQTFVEVPGADLASLSATTTLLDNPLYAQCTKKKLDSGSIALTSSGVVAYDNDSSSWIHFTVAAPEAVDSVYGGRQDGDQARAFSYSGGYSCRFDRRTRVLTRYEDWW